MGKVRHWRFDFFSVVKKSVYSIITSYSEVKPLSNVLQLDGGELRENKRRVTMEGKEGGKEGRREREGGREGRR